MIYMLWTIWYREYFNLFLIQDATKKEVAALHEESELPLEEVLKGLPKEMLEEPSSQLSFNDDDEDPLKSTVSLIKEFYMKLKVFFF